MKTNRLTVLTVLTVLVTSCLMSGSSNETDAIRKDVLGEWEITPKSYESVKREFEERDEKFVVAFHLNADSTAMVIYEKNNERNEYPANWIWKAEKSFGNQNFGLSLKSDVVIRTGGFTVLGLMLNEKDDKLNLKASDYLFEMN